MPVVWRTRSDGVKQRFNLSPLRSEIIKLYLDGLSSRKIGGKLNLSHVRILKILKSENLARRKLIKPILNKNYKNLTPERAYLFGVMCGDGCVFSGTEYKDRWSFKSHIVYLSVKDKDFLDEFVKNFIMVYGVKPNIYYRDRKNNKWSNIWTARVNRKLIYEDLAKYNFAKFWTIPDEVMNSLDKNIICSFLRGIYDSEGSVSLGSRGASISICSVSKSGLEQIRTLLSRINIKSSHLGQYAVRDHPEKSICYYFTITHLNNYLIFLKEIGFSIKRKEKQLLSYIKNLKRYSSSPSNLKTSLLNI
ncbi:MAG: LAGLIDADG family homing endonuclease [Nanoarchaeota archaeon]